MQTLPIIPYLKLGYNEIADGTVFHAPEFCCNKLKPKCESYYEKIIDKQGIHTCPYGFCSYVNITNNETYIYTGLLIENHFNGKLLKGKVNKSNIKLTETQLSCIIKQHTSDIKVMQESISNQQFIENTMHDSKRLLGLIINKSKLLKDELDTKLIKSSKRDKKKFKDLMLPILYSGKLLSYSIKGYSNVTNTSYKKPIKIYDKFFKLKEMLKDTNSNKSKKIILIGSSTHEYLHEVDIIEEELEMLIFEIYHNAIKHTFDSKDIEVSFIDVDDHLLVEIKNQCKYFEFNKDTQQKLFTRNFRINTDVKGSGIGLYNIKYLCDKNDIRIKICCEPIDEKNNDNLHSLMIFKIQLYFNSSEKKVCYNSNKNVI